MPSLSKERAKTGRNKHNPLYKWPLVKRTYTRTHKNTYAHTYKHIAKTHSTRIAEETINRKSERNITLKSQKHTHTKTQTHKHTHSWQQKGLGPWLSWFAGFSVLLVFWQTSKLIDRFIYVKKQNKRSKQGCTRYLPKTTNSAVKTTNQNLIDASQNTMCSIVFREIQNLTNNSISSLICNRNLVLTFFLTCKCADGGEKYIFITIFTQRRTPSEDKSKYCCG